MTTTPPEQSTLKRLLAEAFGEPIHVDPREFLERVLAGMFCRQPDMGGDQRKRLSSKERRAVEDVVGTLLTLLERLPSTEDGVTEEMIEAGARVIDPAAWEVMDRYLQRTLDKYRNEVVLYDRNAFKHKPSMTKAKDCYLAMLKARNGL